MVLPKSQLAALRLVESRKATHADVPRRSRQAKETAAYGRDCCLLRVSGSPTPPPSCVCRTDSSVTPAAATYPCTTIAWTDTSIQLAACGGSSQPPVLHSPGLHAARRVLCTAAKVRAPCASERLCAVIHDSVGGAPLRRCVFRLSSTVLRLTPCFVDCQGVGWRAGGHFSG